MSDLPGVESWWNEQGKRNRSDRATAASEEQVKPSSSSRRVERFSVRTTTKG